MANPVYVLPDAPLAVIQYLRSTAAITALIDPERITTRIDPEPTYPVLLVQRMGGQVIGRGGIDNSTLQVSCIGGSEFECSKLIRTVRATILAIANDVVSEGTLVSGFELVGPSWIPDTTTEPPLSRFILRVQVVLHP